jgi:hypothetical protein
VSDTASDLLEREQMSMQKSVRSSGRTANGYRLRITASAQRIRAEHSDYPLNFIEEHVIEWPLLEFAPPTCTPEQVDELDRVTQTWVGAISRKQRRLGKGQELATLEYFRKAIFDGHYSRIERSEI